MGTTPSWITPTMPATPSNSRRLLVATNNQHKLAEIRAILAPAGINVVSLAEIGLQLEVVEDAPTFAGNAAKKALEVAAAANLPAMADDSGLEVAALRGEPGVYSARYAGTPTNDQANTAKLLHELTGVSDRRARFVCCIALALPGTLLGVVSGDIPGRIVDTPRGSNGFGYDPVFVPDGFSESFAELSAETKNRLSHRANALKHALDTGLFNKLYVK